MTITIKPPFSAASAQAKVEAIQDAWNSLDPERVALVFSQDTQWQNRNDFFEGREAVKVFLQQKWLIELHFRLMMKLWCHSDRRISVRFEYEWQHAKTGQWYRTHGNEHWEFNDDGQMRKRDMCANDIPITSDQRCIKC